MVWTKLLVVGKDWRCVGLLLIELSLSSDHETARRYALAVAGRVEAHVISTRSLRWDLKLLSVSFDLVKRCVELLQCNEIVSSSI